MIADPSVVELIVRVLFLFGYALLFALAEIEIEGAHGWAERLPTWFRVTTPGARLFGLLLSGKPLTGYHLVMFVLPLWSFHIGFVGGAPWSWAAEATTLASYLIWVATWDLLWFLLNPRYGWARFRKGEIWWHGRTWIGRFPIDYWGGAGRVVGDRGGGAAGDRRLRRAGAPRRAGGRLRRRSTLLDERAARPLHALARAHAPPRERRARHRAAAGIERRQRRCASVDVDTRRLD